MSKEAFKQIMEGQSMGATEAAREGIQAVAPGLSLSKILNDIGSEMKQQAAQGAHELAAALFRGSDGFVMYQRTKDGKDDQQHGLPIEAMKQPDVRKEQSMGREM